MPDWFVLSLEIERMNVRCPSIRQRGKEIDLGDRFASRVPTERAVGRYAMRKPRIYRITVRCTAGSDVVQDVGGRSIWIVGRPNDITWIKEAAGANLGTERSVLP